MARRTSRWLRLVVGVPVTLALWCPSVAARAADPPFVGWTAALPALAWQYNPNSSDDCVAGRVACVQKTIRTMQDRFTPLGAACAHPAVFALAYLRTTQTYLQTAQTAGFYADPAFVNHEDAAFAGMYFGAYDDWASGRIDRVPPAWRKALGAAAARQVSGSGDLLLGMNAHVNRDLPFVLAAIGLVAPDGSSRKSDHDQIDAMLNEVVEPLLAEEAARFDPQIAFVSTPYGVGYSGFMQMLVAWRESAWRQAEALVTAPTDAARAQVAAGIEDSAAANAQAIVAATAYTPPITWTDSRDQYCAAHAGSAG